MDKTKKVLESVNENRVLISTSFIIFVLVYIVYITSHSYKLSKTLNIMVNLDKYMHVNSKLSMDNNKKLKLCDFYISSAFRPYVVNNQFVSYIDLEITKKIITSGVRSMYVDVFNSKMGDNAEPVISTGFIKGEWKLSLNTILFDDFCKLLAITIFSPGYVNNFDDPFFLLINLNTNNNYNCLNKIKNIIYKRFKKYLLDNRYTYGKINLAEEFVTEFEKKIVIITSGGYENSSLEELVNSSWKNEIITKINYESLDPAVKFTKSIKFNSGELREYNKNNLTIVTPNEAKFFTHNYHPNYFFESGCQFVCLNYQKFDKHFDKYITKFRRDSFIPKPKRMHGSKKEKSVNMGTMNNVIGDKDLPRNNNGIAGRCPEEPEEKYIPKATYDSYYKKECIVLNKSQPVSGTIEEAKNACSLSPTCKGFTFNNCNKNYIIHNGLTEAPWVADESVCHECVIKT